MSTPMRARRSGQPRSQRAKKGPTWLFPNKKTKKVKNDDGEQSTQGDNSPEVANFPSMPQMDKTLVPVCCPHCQQGFGVDLEVGAKGVTAKPTEEVNDLDFMSNLSILAVEDEKMSRTILSKLLKTCGYKDFTVAENGRRALDLLESNPKQFDLVLCDVMMPEMDGFELLVAIKSSQDLVNLPVIMMSSNDQKNDIFRCIQAGAEDYLVKPISLDALKNLWQHIWRKRNHVMLQSLLDVEKEAKDELSQRLEQLRMQGEREKSQLQHSLDKHAKQKEMVAKELEAMSNQSNLLLNYYRDKMKERSVGVQCDIWSSNTLKETEDEDSVGPTEYEGALTERTNRNNNNSNNNNNKMMNGSVVNDNPNIKFALPDVPLLNEPSGGSGGLGVPGGHGQSLFAAATARATLQTTNDPVVICRICETAVPSSDLHDHSQECLIASRLWVKITFEMDRLSRYLSSLKLQRDQLDSKSLEYAQNVELCDAIVCVQGFKKRVSVDKDEEERLHSVLKKLESESKTLARHCRRTDNSLRDICRYLRELPPSSKSEAKKGSPRSENSSDDTPLHTRSISLDDFETVKRISQGGYGKVLLVKKKRTGDLCALKVMSKRGMRAKGFVSQMKVERDILALMNNPWVVKLYYSFQTTKKLCLVMEYISGGDCMSLLRNLVYLGEDQARFYIAEVAVALQSLHDAGIVHRDLKPDNILIAQDGHIKLTDFGLSRRVDYAVTPATARKGERVLGTPDYIAPEMLLKMGDGMAVDWWSLGVVMFEFLTGITPFNAPTPEAIFYNILNRRIVWPSIPDEMSPEAQDLIASLLTPNPSQRPGLADIMGHPFFEGVEWESLQAQKPPFVPDHSSWYFDEPTKDAWASTSEGTDIATRDAPPSPVDSDAEPDNLGRWDYCNLEGLNHLNQTYIDNNHHSPQNSFRKILPRTGSAPLPRR